MKSKNKKPFRMICSMAMLLMTMIFFSSTVEAATDENVKINALMFDSEAQLISDGLYDIRFSLYTIDRIKRDEYPSNEDVDERIWTIEKKIEMKNGKLKVSLNIPNVKYNKYYLGIRVNQDSEMVPRKAIILGKANLNSSSGNNSAEQEQNQQSYQDSRTEIINENFTNQEKTNESLIELISQFQTGTNPGDIPVLNSDGKINRSLLDIPLPAGSGGVNEVTLNIPTVDTALITEEITNNLINSTEFATNVINNLVVNNQQDGNILVYNEAENRYYSTVLKLELLKDINFSSLNDGDILIYDDNDNEWINKPIVDYSTVYTAGTGISIIGNQISLVDTMDDDSLGVLNCANNEIAKWNAGTSQWECSVDISGAGVATFVTLTDTPNDYGTNGYLVQTDGAGVLSFMNPNIYLDNTDAQTLSIVGHTVSLVNGGNVVIPDSDNQDLSYNAGTHILTLANDGTPVDLSGLNNAGTDDQNLTSAVLNGATHILSIAIEDGNPVNVDLSSLTHDGAAGSVFFAGAVGDPSEDNSNLFWDDANNRLGVGINTPLYDLDVDGSGRLASNLIVGGNTTLGNAVADTITINGIIQGPTPLVFEGATSNGFESTFVVTDPTADRAITFQDATGTVAFVSDIPSGTPSNGTVDDSILHWDAATTQWVENTNYMVDELGVVINGTWNGAIIPVAYGGTGANTLNDLITLGTHTTGNYVQSITTAANSGLTGGVIANEGTIHNLALNINGMVAESAVDDNDEIAMYDVSVGAHRKITRANFLSGILGALTYQGTWDANANNPVLSDATGTPGHYYVVDVAGTQDLGSGNITFTVGDWIVFNDQGVNKWEKLDNTNDVQSVFGRQGIVTSSSGDYTASQITNVPAGNIAATDVQTAINELDVEKQDSDPQLVDVAGLVPADGAFIVGDGVNFITETGNTARTSLGLGTGDSVFFDDLTIANDVIIGDANTDLLTVNGTIQGGSPLVFEGATSNGFESTFAVTDPTADRTITFQDATGTVALTSDIVDTFVGLSDTPAGYGTNGYLVQTDGAGALSYVDPNTITHTGVAGSVFFAGATGSPTDDNGNLFWDDTNNRLGIGTDTPSSKLSIFGTDNNIRLSYDAGNYANLFVNNTGELVMDATNATEAAMIIGSNLAQDTSVQFDGEFHDFFSGIDNSTGLYSIGTGFDVTGSSTDIGPGTVTNAAAGTTVTGTNTKFTATFRVGNQITIGPDTVTITAIASDTSMTTDAITNANTNVAYTYNAGTKVVVEPSGNLGIGMTDPLYALDVRTTGASAIVARFNNASTNTSCTLSTNGGTINCSSDKRLKKNFAPLNDGLKTVLSLHPTTYNWKAESDDTMKMMGFIAQEVQEVLPGLVITDESTGYLQLSTVGMIPVITKAIQEQQAQIKAHDIKISSNTLKTDVNVQTLKDLQISVDSNLAIINQSLAVVDDEYKNLKNKQIEIDSTVGGAVDKLAELSDNINDITVTMTTLTDTALDHEERIALLENLLEKDGGDSKNVDNNKSNNTILAEGNNNTVLKSFSDNLSFLQKELSSEEGGVSDRQVFSLSGDLIMERLKAKKIEAGEIKIEKMTIGGNKESAVVGENKIIAGMLDVFVPTTTVKESSQIFITPKGETLTQLMTVSQIIPGKGFNVLISQELEKDVRFSWFIIEDETSESEDSTLN